ncbi:MORN repeat-containing protein 3, partial [Nowakowskiella sp. JEL0078]
MLPSITDNHTSVRIKAHAAVTQTPQWLLRDNLSLKSGPHATVYLINGDRYLGDWLNNKKHGNGTYYNLKYQSVYQGQFENDKFSGFGTFSLRIPNPPTTSPSSPLAVLKQKVSLATLASESRGLFPLVSREFASPNKFVKDRELRKVYAGGWHDDKRHGRGTMFYDDGNVYDGMWESGLRCGWGRLSYTDGSVYEGEWFREQRHGEGVLVFANGDRYEGTWMHDLKEGPGKFVYKTKRQMYE